MRKISILILFILLFTFGDCDEMDNWDNASRTEFVTDCSKTMAVEYPHLNSGKYCKCMQPRVEKHYTPGDLMLMSGGEVSQAMMEIEQPCLKHKKRK